MGDAGVNVAHGASTGNGAHAATTIAHDAAAGATCEDGSAQTEDNQHNAEAQDARDELALAQRAAQGDTFAFAEIVRRYEARLLAYLTQMLGDSEAARDIAQDTFLAAWQALPRWQAPQPLPAHPLSPWLYRIATNRALSSLRARPPIRSLVPRMEHPPTPGMSFEERYAARELLRTALRQLSPEDAACLVLHFVAGDRYAEIGARLGLSAEAVRKRVARGQTALRAVYITLDTEPNSGSDTQPHTEAPR
ncbi:MAG: sigma-70 family RNA polymerase sigma factor [Ktedonobacterales bacterium]